MAVNGNSFDAGTIGFGHARKVWREIRAVYPGGGTVGNVSDFAEAGKIPAGTPVKFDPSEKTITAYTAEQVKASDADTLGINAYLQEDAVIADANTVATGTAVYSGEIYEYMFDADVAAILKAGTLTPQIVWVQ